MTDSPTFQLRVFFFVLLAKAQRDKLSSIVGWSVVHWRASARQRVPNLQKVDDLFCCDECWIKKMMRGAKLKEIESDMRPYEGAGAVFFYSPSGSLGVWLV